MEGLSKSTAYFLNWTLQILDLKKFPALKNTSQLF